MKADVRGKNPSLSLQNPRLFPNSGGLSNLDGACIEKLLLHCGSALECNNVTLAQQVMWVLNNVASSVGDPNQRLAFYFLRALIFRVSPTTTINFNTAAAATSRRRLMSVTQLAAYVDLIPWHTFGFCAANGAIRKAIQGSPTLDILDFSITHCMQWPTLIDALSKQSNGPPLLRITVVSWRPRVPPLLNVSIEEIGQRLANFAKFRQVPFEFNVIELGGAEDEEGSSSSATLNYDLLLSRLNTLSLKDEASALVVNCQNWLRYLPDQDMGNSNDETSYRDSFLEIIRDLNPSIVTIVDEDCDLGFSTTLATRITACFNYMWIPFDALETFLPKNSPQRIEYESDIGCKIDNIVGSEGFQRIERLESSTKLINRMTSAGFVSAPFCEETVREVKVLLDEHASGWGMKKDEDMLVLTWKGHNAVYATVWVPRASFHDQSV